MKSKRIMLIGGAGFIGHNLALHLKTRGADVCVVDSLGVNNFMAFSSDDVDAINRDLYLKILFERQKLLREAEIPIYVQDARDYHALSKLITKVAPHVVVQLAAVSHANKSNKDPFNTFDHSMRTLENALDASRKRVEHFIFFSSSMVYGHFKEAEVSETTVCEPLGIYGALKYGGEKLVIAYNQAFDLPYTIIRPSALYGERCVSRRVGQIFIENALTNGEITLSGDGSDSLDFTYIGDLVRGVEQIIENDNSKGEIFNLTFGSGRSLSEMASIVKSHFPQINIHYHTKDDLTPDRGTLNISKAIKLIGFQPQFPLEVGYERYINWYKEFYSKRLEL